VNLSCQRILTHWTPPTTGAQDWPRDACAPLSANHRWEPARAAPTGVLLTARAASGSTATQVSTSHWYACDVCQ